MFVRWLGIYFLVLALCAESRADDEIAERVAAAFEAGAHEAVTKLAGRDDPDPWFVAARLCELEKFDAAAAFARAAPRKDTEALPAWVATRVTSEQPDDFAAARDLFERGKERQSARAYEESETAFAAAAEKAEGIGWRAGQAWALLEAARSAFRRSAFPEMDRFAAAALAVEENLECRQGQARAVVIRIHEKGQAVLAYLTTTGALPRLLAYTLQGRHKNAHEDGNDSDNYQ